LDAAPKKIGGYYLVAVAGTSTFDGVEHTLNIGDKIIWDGEKYGIVPNLDTDDAPESSATAFKTI